MSIVDAVTAKQSGTAPTSDAGMKVAVRNRYLGTWSAGFEVVAPISTGTPSDGPPTARSSPRSSPSATSASRGGPPPTA